jgi:hypothetical protein
MNFSGNSFGQVNSDQRVYPNFINNDKNEFQQRDNNQEYFNNINNPYQNSMNYMGGNNFTNPNFGKNRNPQNFNSKMN